MKIAYLSRAILAVAILASASLAICQAQSAANAPNPQPAQNQPQQPEFVRQGQDLLRAGKFDQAIELYKKHLKIPFDAFSANTAMGVALDLMNKGPEARKYFLQAIEIAANDAAKSPAYRAMAMSYAFEGDCAKTMEWEQKVFDIYEEEKNHYQQGEIANEGARVCLDSGDIDTAAKWYKTGYEAGLSEPQITPDRKDLWEFRWEHAQARIAARRGNKAEAQKHVAAAKAVLDKGVITAQQKQFFPYLTGYVAYYGGDYKTALSDLEKANQSDPFIQTLMAETYEKLGDNQKAVELYKKADSSIAHNPPSAYAHRMARNKLK